jgi:hypothetical protein
MLKRFLVLILALTAAVSEAQTGFVHTKGHAVLDGAGHALHLRGIGLGNWMVPEGYMFQMKSGPQSAREIQALFEELIGPAAAADFWRRYRENYITNSDIDFLHQQGFNSVRVPIHYKFFMPGNDEGFALLDHVVEWAHKDGMYVIIDLHAAPGGQTGTNIDDSSGYPWLFESEQSQALTVAIWKRIAAHYKDDPTVLGYDLLNEPIPTFPQLAIYNSRLEPLYRQITAAIRSVDTHHTIILEGAQWAGNFKVFGTPFDSNVIYSVHRYWMPPTKPAIQDVLDFREKYNVPLWMGETGENTDEWVRSFVQVLDTNDIGWSFWPYKKMDATSAPVSFERPAHWDEIVAFAQRHASVADAESLIATRPSLVDSREALEQLLTNIQFSHCHVNHGYVDALMQR